MRTHRVTKERKLVPKGTYREPKGREREPNGGQMEAKCEPKGFKCHLFHFFGLPCGGGTAALLARTFKVRKRVPKGIRSGTNRVFRSHFGSSQFLPSKFFIYFHSVIWRNN